MIEEIKYHYSVANDNKVIKLSEEFLRLEGNANNYEVLNFKAQSLMNIFQDQLAIDTFDVIISNYPEKIDPLIESALCLINIGEYIKAKNQLEKALKLEPNNLDVLYNMIFIEEELHNFNDVIRLSNLAILVDNKEPSIWLTLSSAHGRLGKFQDALDFGIKAIKLCDDNEILLQIAHNNLGYMYSKMNDLENAEIHLRKAIEIDDSEPFAFNNLGLIIAKRGNIEEGFRLINYSLHIDNQNSLEYPLSLGQV